MDGAIGEMLVALLGRRATPCERRRASSSGTSSRGVTSGWNWIAIGGAVAERLDGKGIALGQQFGAARQIEALAVPLIDVVRPAAQIARPAGVGRIG